METAIILPLLILMTFGLIEYGWIFINVEQVTNAARHGARLAARPDSTNAQILAEINAMMADAGLAGSGYTINFTPADVASPPSGQLVAVTVSLVYDNIALTGIPIIPVPTNLRATVAMAKEGP